MNNNYFYKLASIADRLSGMKKYAGEIINAGRKVATSAPKISSPTSTPTTSMQSTTSSSSTSNTSAGTGASAPSQTPTTPASQPGMAGYRPQTPEDLVNHWVAQKEHYYRNRTDKFADRYKDYTVSPEAKRLMAREANKIWTEIGSDPNRLEASHLEREGAFNTAMGRDHQERIDRKKRQEQAAEAPMQNPIATSAIPNPSLNYSTTGSPTQQNQDIQPANAPGQQDLSMHTPRAGSIIRQYGLPAYAQTFQDMQKFSEAWIKQYGYNPDSWSSASREYREAMRQYGSKLYPHYSGMTSFSQYAQDAINRGQSIYGTSQNHVTGVTNYYLDNTYGAGYGTLNPEDSTQVYWNQNTAYNNVDDTGTVPYGDHRHLTNGD